MSHRWKPDVYWKIHAGRMQMELRNASLKSRTVVQEIRDNLMVNRHSRNQNTGISAHARIFSARHQMYQLRKECGTGAKRTRQNSTAAHKRFPE